MTSHPVRLLLLALLPALWLAPLPAAAQDAPPAPPAPEAAPPPVGDDIDPYAADDAAWADDEFAGPQVYDPIEPFNRVVFRFNDAAYRYVLTPVAQGYDAVVPAGAQTAIGNFFDNLAYPVRLVGNLLQGRWRGARVETERFVLNTTVGVGGLFRPVDGDPALQVPAEDVGQAFGAWGVPGGPFLVLPLLGPTNSRDLVGRVGESFLNPVGYLEEWEAEWSLRGAEFLNSLPPTLRNYREITAASIDPYVAIREGYTARRDAQIAE